MLIRLMLSLFKSNIKGRYANPFHYLTEITAILVSLFIYYYTSKAFSGFQSLPLKLYDTDYFTFIVYGEIILSLPIYFLEGTFRQLETSYYEGVFETYDSFPISETRKILLISSYGVFPTLFRMAITIIFAILFFGIKIPIVSGVQCLLFQIIAIPAFLAPGIFACSVWMATGRGKGIIGYFTTITGLLSGALFPISIFPEWIANLSYYLSPFTYLLENSRFIIKESYSIYDFLIKSSIFILWAGLLPLSLYAFKISKKRYYKNDGITTMIV